MSRNPETLARRLVDELGRVTDNQRAASDGLWQVCPGGQAVDRRRLLQSCVGPVLTTDEPSDNQPAAERLRVAKAYLDCKALYAALADRAK
jgi:hypothetical protein